MIFERSNIRKPETLDHPNGAKIYNYHVRQTDGRIF